ncbi:MAG: hypothetical protein NTX86_05355 [Candidatus Dependentiae bacterium]|nr:hypothetical protein [Candidatus Dependentiae bacterium]
MYKKKNEKVKAFRRHHNTRIIKHKRPYSTEEISELLGVHSQTVGTWYKSGLKKMDLKQPYEVWGQDLIDFLNDKNKKRKHTCAPNELFCCKCQQPRKSKNNIACIKADNCRVNIVGKCELCGTKINKTISPQKIDEYKKIFTIQAVHDKDLLECDNTCAITNTNGETERG